MLIAAHKKYHEMGSKEAHLQEKTVMNIARTTSQTGEQLHCEVPIYPDDTREQIKDRMNFFFSLIQDRMEDENRAVSEINEKHQKIRNAKEITKRNADRFTKMAKALEKRLKKNEIDQPEHDRLLLEEREKLAKANAEFEATLAEE